MRDTRLILVEGLPGSGKSTTAQWLCHLLEALGVRAAWHHEQDITHPVYRHDELQQATLAGAAACEAYHERARHRWQELAAAALATNTVTILDSSFLQAPIASMQLARCGEDAMARHVAATETLLASVNPVLILLRHTDTTEVYWRARLQRGPWFEAFLAELVGGTHDEQADPAARTALILDALHAHAAIVHGLAAGVAMPSVQIDITSARWHEHRAQIADFIGVPSLDPHGSVENVNSFVGRYRDLESDQELIVASDERGLFLEVTGTRLLPRRNETFELEGLSIEVTFEPADGIAARMRCAARMPNIGPVWVKA